MLGRGEAPLCIISSTPLGDVNSSASELGKHALMRMIQPLLSIISLIPRSGILTQSGRLSSS